MTPVEGLTRPLDHLFDRLRTVWSHQAPDLTQDLALRGIPPKDHPDHRNDHHEKGPE